MQLYLFEKTELRLKNSTAGGHAPQYPVFFQKTSLFFLKKLPPFSVVPRGKLCYNVTKQRMNARECQ